MSLGICLGFAQPRKMERPRVDTPNNGEIGGRHPENRGTRGSTLVAMCSSTENARIRQPMPRESRDLLRICRKTHALWRRKRPRKRVPVSAKKKSRWSCSRASSSRLSGHGHTPAPIVQCWAVGRAQIPHPKFKVGRGSARNTCCSAMCI